MHTGRVSDQVQFSGVDKKNVTPALKISFKYLADILKRRNYKIKCYMNNDIRTRFHTSHESSSQRKTNMFTHFNLFKVKVI